MADPALPAAITPGIHQGREACVGQLRNLLCRLGPWAEMPAEGVPREVWLCDAQFADWPLDDVAVLESLTRWLRRPGRSLRLLGLDFDALARAHARFSRWRRDWTHNMDVWQPCDGLLPAGLAGMVVGPLALQRLDAPEWRLRVVTDPAGVQILRAAWVDAMRRCEPAWPCTTVGL